MEDSVVLQVDGISIAGRFFLPDKETHCPVVCLCHGAPSGNPPEPGDGGYPELAERICREGFVIFIFNFRGTGDSGGNMDVLGWARDLRAVVDYLRNLPDTAGSNLLLVGFSAGAAISVYVASRDERVSGVAACACPADFSLFTSRDDPQTIIDNYRSIGAVRDADFPPSVEEWFDNFELVTPVNHVAGISPRPVLFVHGSQDEVVPLDHSRRLYEMAGEPKQLVIIDGAGHKLRREDGAVAAILDWLENFRRNSC